MGEVFLAYDARLRRNVAIKRIRRDPSAGTDPTRRFLTEALAVARLDHPNICSIYESDEDADGPFLVMPVVPGETLAAMLRRGPLPIDLCRRIAGQIAAALVAAHAAGVVHRDIKPGNVMVDTDGHVRVMDFGLAKLAAAVAPDDLDATVSGLTTIGTTLGTVAYMSPEQARGQNVDARSDLFSLGVVLYEMVAGHQPFQGATTADVLSAILTREPAPLAEGRPDVSADLARVVGKALEKNVSRRYQSAAEVAADLDTPSPPGPSVGQSPAGWPVVRLALIAGVIVAVLVFSWMLTRTWRSDVQTATGDAGPARLVVLPFENLTRQAEDDWLAGAFSDALSAALQPLKSLILVPRERVVELYTVRSLQEAQRLEPEVMHQLSERLRVRYYVHGSYQRVGEDLRVVARLVDVTAGTITAQETVTDRFANVLRLEDDLARRFAARLGESIPVLDAGTTASPETLRAVSTARGLYARGLFREALPVLEQAVARDPMSADAWALLSKTASRLASPAAFAGSSRDAYLDRALVAANKAVDLQSNLYEGHVATALAYRGLARLAPWRAAAERALTLNSTAGEAHTLLGDSYTATPNFTCPEQMSAATAEGHYRESLRVDPLLPGTYNNLAFHLLWMSRNNEALRTIDDGLTAVPESNLLQRARSVVLALSHRLDEAERELRSRSAGNPVLSAFQSSDLALIEALRGQVDRASKLLRPAEDTGLMTVVPRVLLFGHAHMMGGNMAEGLRYMERAFSISPSCAAWAAVVPAFEPYRQDPQFQAALKRHGVR